MWAICDIASYLILKKVNTLDARDYSLEARIPEMYFAVQSDDFQNIRSYLRTDVYGDMGTKPVVHIAHVPLVVSPCKYCYR